MKNIKRGIAAAALVGLSGGLLLAAPAHAATTTIEVWMDDQRGAQLSPVWDGSTTIASGYTIHITTFPGRDAMLTAWQDATADGGPDIIFDAASTATAAAKNGKALPYTLTATNKAELPAGALKAFSYQGVQYGIPMDVDTTTMYWNTKFGKAPKTFEQFAAAFAKYKKAGKATMGICAADGTWGALPVLTALGGGAWGYAKDGITPNPNKVLFNSPAFIANAKKYLLNKAGKSNGMFAWDGCDSTFLAGKALAMNTGSWRLNSVIDSGVQYTLQPLPALAGKGVSHQWSGFGGAFGTSFANDHGVALGVRTALGYFASQKGALAYANAVKRPPVNSKIGSHLSGDVAGFAKAAATGLVQENALLGDNTGGANWYDVLGSTFDDVFNKGKDLKSSFNKGAVILKADFVHGMTNR